MRLLPKLGRRKTEDVLGASTTDSLHFTNGEESTPDMLLLVNRQNKAMSSVQGVLVETREDKAVEELLDAARQCVDCDHVGLYILDQTRGMVCLADAYGGTPGDVLARDSSILGQVAQNGRSIRIDDASKDPDFEESHSARESFILTRSVLCCAVKSWDGQVVAMLHAINKQKQSNEDTGRTSSASWHGCSLSGERIMDPYGRSLSGSPPMDTPVASASFTWIDEQVFRLLLSMTYQHIQSLQADTFFAFTGQLSTAFTDMDRCLRLVIESTRSQTRCGHAAIFLLNGPDVSKDLLLCMRTEVVETASATSIPFNRIRIAVHGSGAVSKALISGQPSILGVEDDADELQALGALIWGSPAVPAALLCPDIAPVLSLQSAIVQPLRVGSSDPFGLLVLANKTRAGRKESQFSSGRSEGRKESQFSSGRSALKVSSLPGLPTPRRMSRFIQESGIEDQAVVSESLSTDKVVISRQSGKASKLAQGRFNDSDLKLLDVLLSYAVHALHAAEIYNRQLNTNKELDALVTVCAKSAIGMQEGRVQDVIHTLCDHGRRLFHCDRVTFFQVDPLSDQLIGFFIPPGQDSLQTLRVKKAGIVGLAIEEGSTLNIEDAWNDPRFSKDTDMKTGYRTKTILCCPIKIGTGQVVAALQCVNKLSGRVFVGEDVEHFSTVALMLSGIISSHMVDAGMESLMERGDINEDVKQSLQQYNNSTLGKTELPRTNGPDPDAKYRRKPSTELPGLRKGRMPTTNLLENKESLSAMMSWDFDSVNVDESDHSAYVAYSLNRFGLTRHFGIKRSVLDLFVQSVRDDYLSCAYHNWAHAFVTFHVSSLLIAHIADLTKDQTGCIELLEVDQLALLLAALGHDAGHRGMNNTFETATTSELAMRYNDMSPLENHHAAITCGRLQTLKPAITETLPVATVKRLRSVIIYSILHTDMAKHNDSVVWLRGKRLEQPLQEDKDREKSSQELCGALLHSADVSHPVLPWSYHKQLSLLAITEFYAQFQAETDLSLPTLPFMGKDPLGPIKELGALQSGFLNFVVVPLWTALNDFSKGGLQHTVDNVQHNKSLWDRIAEDEEIPDEQPFQLGRIPALATPKDEAGKVV